MRSLTVLIVGAGGREHALVEKMQESDRLGSLWVAPGNAGTSAYNAAIDINDNEDVIAFCKANNVDLVVVGPEGPLVAGLADELEAAGVACFGPSAAAAQLEGSKSFARDFAARHGIPGPQCATFTEVEAANGWLEELGLPVVVKADGLASGKGVIVPETRVDTERAIYDLLADRTMGDAGSKVVLEERLYGEELSLFAITDGRDLVVLGTAQDHKRVGDGDTGPNTGGMGAFAPVPGKAAMEDQLVEQFLWPVVQGMAADGTPYTGVIYAGIMLTQDGPRLIEYNCRFGDPEAQVILPLIETDMLDLMMAAAVGDLGRIGLVRRPGAAATVVVAARGYPTSPALDIAVPLVEAPPDVSIVHASTKVDSDDVVRNTGGRVLAVTGVGADLDEALGKIYPVVDSLVGDELFARTDIGWRYSRRTSASAYDRAGVSFDRASQVTAGIARPVKSTHDDRVVDGFGAFGGVFDVSSLKGFEHPLLVASTDGVGTKTALAEQVGRWHSIGVDIVNHGVNDVLVQGALPLFFLDTVAAARLDPPLVTEIVEGMAAACRDAGCVLLGGETAEMPDVLTDGSVDVSGTMVGVVERSQLLPKPSIAPGHVLVGLRSSGLHTNGYSLARKVVSGRDLNEAVPGGEGETLAEALLAPHRSYLAPLKKVLNDGLADGLAHITGGGLVDNLPRVLPSGCGAVVATDSWTWPPIFAHLVAAGGLTKIEAYRTLNLGIGMVVVAAPDKVEKVQAAIAEPTVIIGRIVAGDGVALD